MTVFNDLKLKNIGELAEWFDKHAMFDDAPWIKWWDKNYCKNCKAEIRTEYVPYLEEERDVEYAWCELNNNKCKFFPNMSEMPDNKEIIKMWLTSEVDENDG